MLRRPNDVRKQAELAKFYLDAATDGRRNPLSSVGRVDAAALDALFDLAAEMKHVDTIFKRVFGEA